MSTGILLLNFGEPERPELEELVPFLEAIFATNFRLEHAADPEAGRRRARELAERRAPALVEEYRRMGRSPLREQTEMQARALDVALRQRGNEARIVVGMQFTAPSIGDAAAELREAGVDRLVGLPVYPLCGPSTTVFALEELRRALRKMPWDVEVTDVTGWHRHPKYTSLRARAIRKFCERRGLDLSDPRTRLVFSAHGTPLHYLRDGSRYDLYVGDHCEAVAKDLGVDRYVLGFQNHANRPGVEWTLPEIRESIRRVEADRVVVVPVSFMQELSETLVELDMDLSGEAEALGLEFHRVPIPYDDPTFVAVLSDVIAEATTTNRRACRCRPGAFCLNDRLEYRSATG